MGYKPTFKKAYMNTYIAELPSIMNDNFDDVSTALNNIVEYDVSGNVSPYIILPVNTSGNVKANVGHFKNLIVDKNIQLDGSINIDINDIKYNETTTLKQKLDQIDTSIKEIIQQLEIGRVGTSNNNVLNASNPTATKSLSAPVAYASLNPNDANLYIAAINSNDSYTYNVRYYMTNAVVYDPSVFKCKADYIDVLNKTIYRYYNVYNNKYIKIDNEYTSCFRNCNVGDVVIPIFNPNSDHDFILSLGDRNITIKYEDYHITTLQLICVGVDENGKCIFNIVNYNGKISIE